MPASAYAFLRHLIGMQAGSLTFVEGETEHQLGAGDCLGFGPPQPVALANESAAACSYVVGLVRG